MKVEPIRLGDAAPGLTVFFTLSELSGLAKDCAALGLGQGVASAFRAVVAMDPDAIRNALGRGVKNPDGSVWSGNPNDIHAPLIEMRQVIGDALALRLYGKRLSDLEVDGGGE